MGLSFNPCSEVLTRVHGGYDHDIEPHKPSCIRFNSTSPFEIRPIKGILTSRGSWEGGRERERVRRRKVPAGEVMDGPQSFDSAAFPWT